MFTNGNLRQAHFKAAVEQVVGVLDRHCTRPAAGFGQGEELHGAPRRFVGQANVADLAGLHLFVQGFERFLQWGEVVFVLVLVAQLAEEVGAALRPVQLVEVDPVGLQALEAGVEGCADVLAVVAQVAIADIVDGVAGAGDLAGKHPVGAVATAFEVVANVAFGGGVGVGLGRYRVHFCGVEEVDPRGLGPFDLREGLCLAVLLAPGHGAQRDRADIQIGAAQLSVIHRVLLRGKTIIKAG